MISSIKDKLREYSPRPLEEHKQYAVLLPLVYEKATESWQVLYQVRSQSISQPGEVSFPGGSVEEGESFEAAAVRETCEELLITPEQIEILGEIDYLVHGKRTIHCFVGQIHIEDWLTIKPNEEVDHLFTIPLDELLATSPTYYQLHNDVKPETNFPYEKIPNGQDYAFTGYGRKIPFYDLTPETLWGMTALFTHRFCQIIKGERER